MTDSYSGAAITDPFAAQPRSGDYAVPAKGGTTASAPGQNTMYLRQMRLTKPALLAAICVEATLGVAASTLELAVYSDVGNFPGQLLGDFGAVDTSVTGSCELPVNFTAPQIFWLASVRQTAAGATFRVSQSLGSPIYQRNNFLVVSQFQLDCLNVAGVVAALPQNISPVIASTFGDVNGPLVGVKFA